MARVFRFCLGACVLALTVPPLLIFSVVEWLDRRSSEKVQ